MNVGKAVRIRGASQDNDGYEQKKRLIDWLIDWFIGVLRIYRQCFRHIATQEMWPIFLSPQIDL